MIEASSQLSVRRPTHLILGLCVPVLLLASVGCAGGDSSGQDGSVEFSSASGDSELGKIQGMVTRSEQTHQDGVGTLILAVLTAPPFLEVESSEVARATHSKVDLSADGSSEAFEVRGVPPRAEPYVVMAVFDDSGDLGTSGIPQPSTGDLVNRLGAELTWPTVVVTGEAPALLDLDLNYSYPPTVGGHPVEGDWTLVPGSEGDSAPPWSELQLEGEKLSLGKDGSKETYSYSVTLTAGLSVLSMTSSAGATSAFSVSWHGDDMIWTAQESASPAAPLRWKRSQGVAAPEGP